MGAVTTFSGRGWQQPPAPPPSPTSPAASVGDSFRAPAYQVIHIKLREATCQSGRRSSHTWLVDVDLAQELVALLTSAFARLRLQLTQLAPKATYRIYPINHQYSPSRPNIRNPTAQRNQNHSSSPSNSQPSPGPPQPPSMPIMLQPAMYSTERGAPCKKQPALPHHLVSHHARMLHLATAPLVGHACRCQ